jgi:hypothetical protein
MSLASWRPFRDRMSMCDPIHRLFNAFMRMGVAKEERWRSRAGAVNLAHRYQEVRSQLS